MKQNKAEEENMSVDSSGPGQTGQSELSVAGAGSQKAVSRGTPLEEYFGHPPHWPGWGQAEEAPW